MRFIFYWWYKLRLILFLMVFGLFVFIVKNFFITSFFNLQEIELTGNCYLNKNELLKRTKLSLDQSIFQRSLTIIRKELLKDPWIRKIAIKRVLPDKIIISLKEEKPIGFIWQNGIKVLTKKGKIIPNNKNYTKGMVFTGTGVEKNAQKLMQSFYKMPILRNLVLVASFIGERRWDLELANNILIRLPHDKDYSKSLVLAHKLLNKLDLNRMKNRIFDLRFNGLVLVKEIK